MSQRGVYKTAALETIERREGMVLPVGFCVWASTGRVGSVHMVFDGGCVTVFESGSPKITCNKDDLYGLVNMADAILAKPHRRVVCNCKRNALCARHEKSSGIVVLYRKFMPRQRIEVGSDFFPVFVAGLRKLLH